MPRQNPDGSWTYSHDEHLYTNQQSNTANFAASIFNNPKLKKKAKSLIKEAYPDLQIPDYDLQNQFDAFRNEEAERKAAEQQRQEQEKQEQEFRAQRQAAQDKYGLTEEGMLAVEEHMRKNFIGNYDVAARDFVATKPESSEATYDTQFWHHEKQAGFDDIAKDPEKWGRVELEKAFKNAATRQRGGI